MMIGDNRGQYKMKQSEENRLLIYDFFCEDESATQKECADALGLSIGTVNRHVKAIRAGWEPKQ